MARVTVPEGCKGLEMADGTKYNAGRDGRVNVTDDHAAVLGKSWYKAAGVMSASERFAMGTRTGRLCTSCEPSRRWNAWNTSCPRCGADTITEQENQHVVCPE